MMPIDLDFSVDSPISFANQFSEKTEIQDQQSKNYSIPQNLPTETSPSQLRIELQELGISISDSQSQKARNQPKKHLVLSKNIVLEETSEIGPSSVSQDSDRSDKDQTGGGWSAFDGSTSDKKESGSNQIKSWFASMKKQDSQVEPESVQSQLNKVFPGLQGINTFPELEEKQQAESKDSKNEEKIDLKHEQDFGEFQDAKSQEEKDEEQSPKIFDLEQQVIVNRPSEGMKDLSFIHKIEFDEGKLLSNFEQEFKEDMPRRSTIKTITAQKDESVAQEIARQEILFSARPSITHRESQNCFDHFHPTELPKQISKLALSNQEEMKTLARFLFEKGLFKQQKQIQLESLYQREIVELNVQKRKAMEADELELAIQYRQKIKAKQAQMHGQQYLEEIEEKLLNLNSEQDEEYWIWNDFKNLMEECLRLKRVSKDDYSEKYIESLKIYEAQLKEVIEETNQEGYEALLLEMKNKTNILKNVKRLTLQVIAQKCSLICEGLNQECVKLKERIAGLVQILADIDDQGLREETMSSFLHSAQFSTFYLGVYSLRRIRSNLFSSLSQINAYIESSVSIEIEGTLQQLGNLEQDFQQINMLLDELVQESETSLRAQNGRCSSDKFNFIDTLSQPLASTDSDAEYEFKSFLKTLIEI